MRLRSPNRNGQEEPEERGTGMGPAPERHGTPERNSALAVGLRSWAISRLIV